MAGGRIRPPGGRRAPAVTRRGGAVTCPRMYARRRPVRYVDIGGRIMPPIRGGADRIAGGPYPAAEYARGGATRDGTVHGGIRSPRWRGRPKHPGAGGRIRLAPRVGGGTRRPSARRNRMRADQIPPCRGRPASGSPAANPAACDAAGRSGMRRPRNVWRGTIYGAGTYPACKIKKQNY